MNAAQCAGFLQHLEHWQGEALGKPFTLEPWQYQFLTEALSTDQDGRPEWSKIVLVLPRGNGKTTLLAAVALYRLIFDIDNPQVLLCAASDRQAGRLFDACEGFCARSPDLLDRVAIQAYKGLIYRLDNGGTIQRISSNPATAHGWRPSLVVADELARWSAPALRKTWAALTTGSVGRVRPQVVAISTAGSAHERSEGILGRLIDHNERDGQVERVHRGLTISRNPQARTLVYNYAAPTTEPENAAAMKLANPASWVSENYLAAQAASPELTASEVLQLHGCVWSQVEEGWINPEVWDAAASPEHVLRDREKIALAFDGSRTRDATCFVGCSLETGVVELLELWERPAELSRQADWSVTSTQVDQALDRIANRFEIVRLYGDPFPAWHSEIEAWSRRLGWRTKVVKFGGSPRRMGPAIERFATDLREGAVRPHDDPRLRRHILAAHAREHRGGVLLEKPSRSEYDFIDCAIGCVLSWEARMDSLAAGDQQVGVLLTF